MRDTSAENMRLMIYMIIFDHSSWYQIFNIPVPQHNDTETPGSQRSRNYRIVETKAVAYPESGRRS